MCGRGYNWEVCGCGRAQVVYGCEDVAAECGYGIVVVASGREMYCASLWENGDQDGLRCRPHELGSYCATFWAMRFYVETHQHLIRRPTS